MKKHRIFIFVFALAAIVVAGLLFYCPDCEGTPPPPPKAEIESLRDSIVSLENDNYNQASVDYVKTKLQAQQNIGKIDQRQYTSMMASLEISTQISLTNSINDWVRNNCTAGDIASIISLASSFQEKNIDLINGLALYKSYQHALSYSGKLQALLADKYDPSKAKALTTSFQSAIRGKAWINCPNITKLKSHINNEIQAFENFHGKYTFNVGSLDNNLIKNPNYFEINKKELLKYPFYFNNYNQRKKDARQ
jgi:hypothetical protein